MTDTLCSKTDAAQSLKENTHNQLLGCQSDVQEHHRSMRIQTLCVAERFKDKSVEN